MTSDGTSYEIRHPELVMVAVGSAVIGYPTRGSPMTMARYDIVSMLHIVRLEPMPVVATGGGGGKRIGVSCGPLFVSMAERYDVDVVTESLPVATDKLCGYSYVMMPRTEPRLERK